MKMRIVIFLQKPKWNSIFGMVGNAVSLSDRWSFCEIYMWEAVSATAGIKGKGLITLQPRIGSILELHYSHNYLILIKLNCFPDDVFLSPPWNCVDHSLVQSVGQRWYKLVWYKNWSHTKISAEENILKRLRTDIA